VSSPIKLRRPFDSLAGCIWLPRFIDKARHHLAGTLPPDYVGAFCNPLGIDGIFLSHLLLKRDELLEVIRRESTDEAIAGWFAARRESAPERIAAWNELAPQIGKPGFPCARTFRWTLKYLYPGCTDPRVTTNFLAIAWDEGYLDDCLRATGSSAAS
jgi:hypothetical protein